MRRRAGVVGPHAVEMGWSHAVLYSTKATQVFDDDKEVVSIIMICYLVPQSRSLVALIDSAAASKQVAWM